MGRARSAAHGRSACGNGGGQAHELRPECHPAVVAALCAMRQRILRAMGLWARCVATFLKSLFLKEERCLL
jgi:hypothetical protein